jgi:predicted  nucleic acid-binding Zn-ribbon protein
MPALSLLQALWPLVETDKKLLAMKERLESFPKEIALHEAELKKAQAALTAAKESLRRQMIANAEAELDSSATEADYKKVEESVGGVKNKREYSLFESRMRECREKIGRLEIERLEGAVKAERLSKMEKEQADLVENLTKRLEEVKHEVEISLAPTKIERAKLMGERKERKAALERAQKGAYDAYWSAFQRTKGDAMAELASESCGKCRMKQSAAVVQSVYQRADLARMRCPACGRILTAAEK